MQAFLKENDYIWESGIEGHYTYGFQGKLLKNKIEDFLRKSFKDFNEIETPLILHKNVWIRSGHWNKFCDPIIKTKGGNSHRVDHLIEKYYSERDYSKLSFDEVIKYLKDIPLDNNDEFIFPELEFEHKDLMMKLTSGHHEVALRPETATATYNNFRDMLVNHQMPIKVFQIGKSLRNEISPRNGILRGREFTQAEFQVILNEEYKKLRMNDDGNRDDIDLVNIKNIGNNVILDLKSYYGDFIKKTYRIFCDLGIPRDKIRLRQHSENEKAFYAIDAWDIEVNLNQYGWYEIAGIHDRGCHDLHDAHILEIAIGVDRLLYSILDVLYEKKDVDDSKNIFKIPYQIAPIQVCVLPLYNKDILTELAEKIYHDLNNKFICKYMTSQSIGKRYMKASMMGIPYCITVDYQSLEDGMVTIRDRDSEKQNRIAIKDIKYHLLDLGL